MVRLLLIGPVAVPPRTGLATTLQGSQLDGPTTAEYVVLPSS
jgi:hypothetical protein